MIKKKKKIICIISLIIVLIFGIIYSQIRDSFNKVQIVSYYDFTEHNLSLYGLDESEKDVINLYLKNHYSENEGFFLIVNNDYGVFEKIYHAYSTLKNINVNNSEFDLERLQDLFYKCETNIGNYNIPTYDYVYYLAMKKMLGESVQNEIYISKMREFQDRDTGLIYYLSAIENVDTKLLITAKIINVCNRHNIDIEDLNLVENIYEISEGYKFKQYKEGDSLYNSGGTLIYALSVCGKDYENSEEKNEWFEKWRDYYKAININDEKTYIEYYSYYQVAKYFGIDESSKIREFINKNSFDFEETNIMELTDIYDYIIIEYADELSYEQKEKIGLYVNNKIMEVENSLTNIVDIASTFYGSVLAYATGFDMEFINVRCNIESLYNDIYMNLDDESFVYNTYYYVMLMQGFEGKGISDEMSQIINQRLDDIIARNIEDDDINIGMLRRVAEIKSNTDAYVFEDDYNKIKEIFSDIIKEKVNNSTIVDIIKIDKILKFDMVTDKYIDECISSLFESGMYRCKEGELPDIKTTYMFYSLLTNHEVLNFSDDDINNMKRLLQDYECDGLYKYEIVGGYMDIRSIYYGYILKNIYIGDSYAKKI